MIPKRNARTRIVTAVTLIAMFALGATSARGAGTCMQAPEPAAQPTQHDHGAPTHSEDSSIPCQHALAAGTCAAVTLPAATAGFSVIAPTIYVARISEAQPLHRLSATTVFHPPRF